MKRFATLLLGFLQQPASQEIECRIDGKEAVLHARAQGYAFAISPIDTTGTCTIAGNDVVYIASARSTEGTSCLVRLFAGKRPVDSTNITRVQLTNDDDRSVLIAQQSATASTDSTSVPVAATSASVPAWTVRISAPAGQTRRYRVSSMAITTNKECDAWKTRF